MPAAQGAEPGTYLAHEDMLPLPDHSCEAMLLIHCLEFAMSSQEVLKDVWRVLTPGGSLFVLVPYMYGLWAHFSVTPFGLGRAFSKTGLRTALGEAGFRAEHCTPLLSVPWFSAENFLHKRFIRQALESEKILPGVLAMQGTKTLYRPVLSHDVESLRECSTVKLARVGVERLSPLFL
jgi:SAM-dependent methyltransferase